MSAAGLTSELLVKVICKELSDAGISQSEAARRSGIALSTLRRRLNGESPFFMYELVPIAAILGVTVSSLFRTAEAAI